VLLIGLSVASTPGPSNQHHKEIKLYATEMAGTQEGYLCVAHKTGTCMNYITRRRRGGSGNASIAEESCRE
jgi:hypothetical protein